MSSQEQEIPRQIFVRILKTGPKVILYIIYVLRKKYIFHIWSVLLSTTIRNSLQSVPSEAIILFCKNFKTHPTVTYPSYKKRVMASDRSEAHRDRCCINTFIPLQPEKYLTYLCSRAQPKAHLQF